MCTKSVQTEKVDIHELPELLTTEQARQVLNVAPSTIYKLCRQQKFTAIQVLSTWRINRDSLLEYAGLK